MKKTSFFLLGFAIAFCACHPKADALVGEWKPEKVNVHFDENRSTPEIVKQIGEMEKQNRITITPDSLLVFSSLNTETRGRLSVDGSGTLYCEGQRFGQWNGGQITTVTPSPLGEITVVYGKK